MPHMTEHTHYEFAGLVQRKTKAGKCNMDEHVLFNQKRKQTDLFPDEATGKVLVLDQTKEAIDTRMLDIGISDD